MEEAGRSWREEGGSMERGWRGEAKSGGEGSRWFSITGASSIGSQTGAGIGTKAGAAT